MRDFSANIWLNIRCLVLFSSAVIKIQNMQMPMPATMHASHLLPASKLILLCLQPYPAYHRTASRWATSKTKTEVSSVEVLCIIYPALSICTSPNTETQREREDGNKVTYVTVCRNSTDRGYAGTKRASKSQNERYRIINFMLTLILSDPQLHITSQK